MARQPTMSDIAKRVGVSRVAVSYALNGRPGVSEELRRRILEIAQQVGFVTHGPAAALHGASSTAIGLVLRRSTQEPGTETFRRQLISGIETELAVRDFGLALQFVADSAEEIDVYRRWHAERRVDGVVICDVRQDDPRIDCVRQLGLPAVIVGGPRDTPAVANLWIDETTAAAKLAQSLATLGHRRAVHMSGPADLLQTHARIAALQAACVEVGISVTPVACSDDGEVAAQLTRRILSALSRPTVIVYDSDLMAIAGLGVAAEMGMGIPQDLSIAAWQDSLICQLVHPAITVLQRNVIEYGARSVRLLFETVNGRPPRSTPYDNTTLVIRDSTGPAPTSGRPRS